MQGQLATRLTALDGQRRNPAAMRKRHSEESGRRAPRTPYTVARGDESPMNYYEGHEDGKPPFLEYPWQIVAPGSKRGVECNRRAGKHVPPGLVPPHYVL
jgi:hypothetical protein